MQPISKRAQRAGQIKGGGCQYDCKYIQLHLLILLILWAIIGRSFRHTSKFSRLQGEKKKRKKKNTVVKFYTVKRETLTERKRKREGVWERGWEWERELARSWTKSWMHPRAWGDRKAIDFWQKCQFIILRDTCDRFLLSFVCDFVPSKPVAMINSSSCSSFWAEDGADQRISLDDLISKVFYFIYLFTFILLG